MSGTLPEAVALSNPDAPEVLAQRLARLERLVLALLALCDVVVVAAPVSGSLEPRQHVALRYAQPFEPSLVALQAARREIEEWQAKLANHPRGGPR